MQKLSVPHAPLKAGLSEGECSPVLGGAKVKGNGQSWGCAPYPGIGTLPDKRGGKIFIRVSWLAVSG